MEYDTMNKLNTATMTDNGKTSVIYYNTPVVQFTDKTIILETGGYFTKSTKDRMNQASQKYQLGFSVYQSKGNWYCEYKGIEHAFTGTRLELSI